ncbi:CDP-glycerol glycerophosphotransferase family protein [Plesiomonas shigelloides]|uniref:Glycosyl/glycerophosphatetransferase n=1 Tax=Plesiomonas shigelloides TaxID=703 RepID=A0A6I1EYG6_PLESH|nr:CDP-glycerol glycerophosphotransferase family protein [Plesiomonas shigelloides]KAB7664653.1 hypothetical protein GBN25_08420 [Plesiomonas shigelloides]QCH03205.1 glycosyl/glycerophosphatetransferase [Plesiomonas shigelloides]
MVILKKISIIFQWFPYLLSFLIPKNNKVWIFGAWGGKGFSDNSKFLFLHVLKNKNDIKAYWIVKDDALFKELINLNLPVLKATSLKGLWYQARAGVLFYSHSVQWDFFAPIINFRVKRIQLWHGLPIKKIGYDSSVEQAQRRSFKRLVTYLFFPFLYDRHDLVISCSDYHKDIFTSAFDVDANDVVVTGYPRYDFLFGQVNNSVKNKKIINSCNILYIPTFRGDVGSDFRVFKESGMDYSRMSDFLSENNAYFWIKLHPVQKLSSDDSEMLKKHPRIKLLEPTADVMESLIQCDIAVIDYSSIYFDLLFQEKPFIMAPFDLDSYMKNDRELYFDYASLSPRPIARSWSSVYEHLSLFMNGDNFINSTYLEKQKQFHKYIDNQSSKRVVDLVLSKFNII